MRLIDAEAIEKVFYTMSMCSSSLYCKTFNAGAQRMFDEIQDAPTIDAVQVVRCGECKLYHKNTYANRLVCTARDNANFVNPEDYCNRGKRKDDDPHDGD
jgi:hypothetical protein